MENFKENNRYKILTPNGFSNFKGIKKNITNILFNIKLDDNSIIQCTAGHELKLSNGEYFEVQYMEVGEQLFDNKVIIDISYIEGEFDVYDAIDVELGHEYYTNEVVSSNCAFIPFMEEIWTAAQMTLATGGDAILLSCVVGDTFVYTNKGICEVSDFVPNNGLVGDYEIESYKIFGKDKLRNGKYFKNNGLVDTKKIITKYTTLEGSLNHKLWANKNNKWNWHSLDELNVNDKVTIQYGYNIWGKSNLLNNLYVDETIAYKLGLLFNFKDTDSSLYSIYNLNDLDILPKDCLKWNKTLIQKLLEGIISHNFVRNNIINIKFDNIKFAQQVQILIQNFGYLTEIVKNKNVYILKLNVSDYIDIINQKEEIDNCKLLETEIIGVEFGSAETYDFSLDKTDDFWCHSIVYNGLLGHQTPNGVGNIFHQLWVKAENEVKSDDAKALFNPISLKWDLHPERTQVWRDEQTAALGAAQAAQECDCLNPQTTITVRNTLTNQIEIITIQQLHQRLALF